MAPRTSTISLLLFGACLLAPSSSAANVNLTLQFRDSGGTPLAVRVGVFQGVFSQPPGNLEGSLYQGRGSFSYFYTSGNTTVSVPTGAIWVRAGRGFEYQALDTLLAVTSPRIVTLTLSRIINMKNLGWYSGDTHVHISHPPVVYNLDGYDLSLVARGEELNFINSMEEQPYFTGVNHPASTSERIIYFSKEQRNAHFSHLSVLGLKQWFADVSGCGNPEVACGGTLDESLYTQLHTQPGEIAVIATHPFSTFDPFNIVGWPGVGMWRGMAIDLASGSLDAIDLMNYSNAAPPASVDPYFHVLNAGFRIPSSAGTDCSLGSGGSAPAGVFRVYVDPAGAFNMDSWIAALKAGRSFVTNYPLFTQFNVEGAVAGDVLNVNSSTLHGTVSVVCRLPFQRIEIWGDTGLQRTLTPPNGSAKSMTSSFDVASAGLTWIVARVTGAASGWHIVTQDGLFAQTAPIYLERDPLQIEAGVSYTRLAAAEFFLERLDETGAVFDTLGAFPNGSRAAFDLAVASARAFYEAIATTPTDVETPSIPSAWALRNAWPNPFGTHIEIDYTTPPGGGEHSVAVYDAAGRVVSVIYSGRRDGGDHRLSWDGRDARGHRVASGVYFVRMRAAGAPIAAGRKIVLLR